MTDLSSNASTILAIVGIFCGFAVLVVIARVCVRSMMLKTMGADDYVIVSAALCAIGVLVCFVGESKHGVGMHTKSITPEENKKIKHWTFYHNLLVTGGISLVKISVACFLLRLVPRKGYQIFLYGMIIFLIAFTLASEGTIMFSCLPIRASWDRAGEPNAKCFTMKTFTDIGLFNSCINISTDILFATLPIPIIWSLHTNIRTRLSLIGVLSLGYAACGAAIVKAVLQTRVLQNKDSTRNDAYALWNNAELCVGILAASLPSLRPLFRSILESTKTLSSRKLETGVAATGNIKARNRYYMQEEESIRMDNFNPVKSAGRYNATISSKMGSHMERGWHSEEDFVSKDGREGSSEHILPWQAKSQGITKTVNVVLQRS